MIVGGLALGMLFRWWALGAAAAFGVWIGLTTSVDEVPAWFLGVAYALFVSLGVALGVAARRATKSP
jgi:hypothetical protein